MHSGHHNVAATEPHNALSRWLLDTTKKRSVGAHAKSVSPPPPFREEELRHGVEHYHNTCVRCHGAPASSAASSAKAPKPPDLSKAANEWGEQEIFWIVRHGVKFTGMPAIDPP